MSTSPFPVLPDETNEPEEQPPRLRQLAWWKYVIVALSICLILALAFRILLLFVTVAVVALAAGTLLWFFYWLVFSRRGLIGRRVHLRRMEARRRERWLRHGDRDTGPGAPGL